MPNALIIHTACALTDALAALLGSSYTVHICHSSAPALPLIRQLQPDILIVDLSLPDGFALLKEAKEWSKYIVVLTTIVTDAIAQQAENVGVDEVILVPCNIHDLVDRLNRRGQENAPSQKV